MIEQGLSIREVSAITGVNKATLRYWQKEFGRFLKTNRTKGNQRRYTRDSVQVIEEIKKLLHEELYTIEGAKAVRYKSLDLDAESEDTLMEECECECEDWDSYTP